ncbi:MAG: hypothetical protein O7F12_02615 [Nitrospirae bacterium]|nr:hypothetical protein [Nitrospirota bacterium]
MGSTHNQQGQSVALNILVGLLLVFSGAFFVAWPEKTLAMVIENQTFEGGGLGEWRTFTTSNGTVGDEGFPDIHPFDVGTQGKINNSVRFQVGHEKFDRKMPGLQGGGIFTTFDSPEGSLTLSCDIAVTYTTPDIKRNLEGGVFELVVDGKVFDQFTTGPINQGATIRHRLQSTVPVQSGIHDLRIRITRPFGNVGAPFQFIDNIEVSN